MMGNWDDEEDKDKKYNDTISQLTRDLQQSKDALKNKEWEYHTLRRLVYNAIKHHTNDLTHIITQHPELFDKLMKEATDRRVTDQSNEHNRYLNKIYNLERNIAQIESLGGNADAVKEQIAHLQEKCQTILNSNPHNTELY